ncbi:putative adhesin [Murinocardiopsis flavida]|uniref:Putative adhesin n=1 Tax=Murinocardiopsis flavida TaxID=645275 RepID=A0A2P8DNY3_9ACTN|nr:DUF4097 family beta strand repeat-containing protein [Murinocardiopsis flavida]PSK98916.1 putative adhesin [Murinocardiopsis flavida]
MPTFTTPEPISVKIDLAAGHLRIIASDRTDTRVEVRPSDAANESDAKAAEQARVDYADGRLLVKAPQQWRQYGFFGSGPAIDVTVELPSGSHVEGDTSAAAFHCEGRLGECRIKSGAGDIALDQTGPLRLSTTGDITVGRAVGHCEATTASGSVRIRTIDGTAVIKNSNGDTWIGEATGDLRLKSANGRISVGKAHATCGATSANGDITIGAVMRGSTSLETAVGEVEIGIVDGTAARLDLSTQFGTVHTDLDAADGPGPGDETVTVRARTAFGDIVVHRS